MSDIQARSAAEGDQTGSDMNPAVQALLSASAFIAAVIAAGIVLRVMAWARVGWRVDVDQPPPSDGPAVRRDGRRMRRRVSIEYPRLVDDRSLVVLRLRNSGLRRVRGQDWMGLSFTFPGRKVITAETEPASAKDLVQAGPQQGGSQLVISTMSLRPRDKPVRLVVLLSGSGRGVEARGALLDGEIVQERWDSLRSRHRLAFAASEALLLFLAAGVVVTWAFF
jgi:hypothetical protein